MKIYFKKLIMNNFMSYQNEEINLDRHGFVLVSGVNNNPVDNASSNGVGKSSIFSAISWALSGLTVSGSKEVSNIYLKGTTSVELHFSMDNTNYVLARYKNPSNLKLYINGEDKSGKGIRDTEKILSEYLPDLTYTLLNSVIILGQGLPQKFTDNSPSGRKEVLEKLSNSDFMITDLKSRVASRKSKLDNLLQQENNKIIDASARQDIITSQLNDLTDKLNTYSETQYQDLQLKYQTKETEKNKLIAECDSIIKTITTISEEVLQLNTDLSSKALTYEQGKDALDIKSTETLSEEILNLQVDIRNLSDEITRLDSISDICPTCGQKLPDVVIIDTTEKKQQLNELNDKNKHLQQQFDDIKSYNENVLQAYQDEYQSSVQEQSNKIQQLNQQLTQLTNSKNQKETSIADLQHTLQEIDFEIQTFTKNKEELTQNIDECRTELESLQNQLLDYNNNVERISKHLEINSKMNTALTREFRGYLLSSIIDYVAQQAKQYTLEIFGVDNLEFVLDGNNINIRYDSKEYEVLSGGEKQKIDVIIQFAIRDMLCAYLNFSSNILVLDEITDNLDIVGSQNMFNLISNKLNDVETIYIISHHQDDFGIPYDDQINIVKGADRISRIIS